MKKFFVFLCTFVLFLNILVAPLSVLAAELPEGVTDYSNLQPDENGRYWIYFEIVSDELMLTDESINYCDLQIYVDVTDYYLQYGHAGLFAYTNVYGTVERIMSACNIPGSTSVYHTNFDFIVNGTFNDIVFENYTFSHSTNFFDNIVAKLGLSQTTANNFIHNSSYTAIKYLPVMGSTAAGKDTTYLFWDYVQEKPNIIVPAPQEPVFEYAYSDAYYTSTASGVDVILRYPYETSTDYYNKINELEEIPLMSIDGTKLCRTIIFVRLTCDVGGTVTSTYWAPVGSIGYAEESSTWSAELLYYFFPDVEDYVTEANVWIESWMFGNSWSGKDGMSYLHFDLSQLPEFLSNCGVEVGTSPVTLLNMEVSAQNFHTGIEKYSDIVYSAYDFNTQTVGSGSVSSPGTTINGVTGVTVNNTIVTGNTSTLPTINNTVNQGDVNVTVNNNIPGNMNVNLNVKTDGDKGKGVFGWLADKAQDAADTVSDIDNGFNNLLTNINTFLGRFPSFFSWIYAGLPADYVTWLNLGIAATVVITVLRKMRIW